MIFKGGRYYNLVQELFGNLRESFRIFVLDKDIKKSDYETFTNHYICCRLLTEWPQKQSTDILNGMMETIHYFTSTSAVHN